MSVVVTLHVEVDVSKLRSKKSLTINEGGGSLIVKPIDTLSKDKRKGLEPTDEEKKRMKELEINKVKYLIAF